MEANRYIILRNSAFSDIIVQAPKHEDLIRGQYQNSFYLKNGNIDNRFSGFWDR